ncbi:MAG: hypothetical protein ABIG39_04780, partial [Candidatus Micrarchaeota archaeon]
SNAHHIRILCGYVFCSPELTSRKRNSIRKLLEASREGSSGNLLFDINSALVALGKKDKTPAFSASPAFQALN